MTQIALPIRDAQAHGEVIATLSWATKRVAAMLAAAPESLPLDALYAAIAAERARVEEAVAAVTAPRRMLMPSKIDYASLTLTVDKLLYAQLARMAVEALHETEDMDRDHYLGLVKGMQARINDAI